MSDLDPIAPASPAPSGAAKPGLHPLSRLVRRRALLKAIGLAGAAPAGALLAGTVAEAGDEGQGRITRGDVAILRFLAAAELIETDLWEQYTELGGVNGGNPAYMAALSNLDGDMPQYIFDNTDDERTHEEFLNAYLMSKGAQPVNLDAFRTLPSTKATGAKQKGRLTNLMSLNVDTSWYLRYRSNRNPDLGASFPQALTIRNQPAIPISDDDTPPNQDQPIPPANPKQARMQAIANTAGFHFASIEVGGSSLYTTLAQKVTNLEVLRIVVSIGGTEVNHFAVWHDKAGNGVNDTTAPITDPVTGLTFPDFNKPPFGGEQFQTNLIFPEPTQFLSPDLPLVSIIRPSTVANGGAMAAVRGLTASNLFAGQSRQFFEFVGGLAAAADAAHRQGPGGEY